MDAMPIGAVEMEMDGVNEEKLGKVARRQLKQRERLLRCLESGSTAVEACEIAGVSSSSFYRWLQEVEVFAERVEDVQFERSLEAFAELKAQAFGRLVWTESVRETKSGPVKTKRQKWVSGRIGALRLYLKRIGAPMVDPAALADIGKGTMDMGLPDGAATSSRDASASLLLGRQSSGAATSSGDASASLLLGRQSSGYQDTPAGGSVASLAATPPEPVSLDRALESGETPVEVSQFEAEGVTRADIGQRTMDMELPAGAATSPGDASASLLLGRQSSGYQDTPAGSLVASLAATPPEPVSLDVALESGEKPVEVSQFEANGVTRAAKAGRMVSSTQASRAARKVKRKMAKASRRKNR